VIAADRAFAALIVTLLAGVALMRPMWRAVDPFPAQMIAAREAWFAGESVDPWGRPWYLYADFSDRPFPADKRSRGYASLGPNGVQGYVPEWTGEIGLWYTTFYAPNDDFAVGATSSSGGRWSIPLPETRPYELAPFLPFGLVVVVLLTRALSAVVRRRPDVSRYAVAAALALLPSAYVWGVVVNLEAIASLTVGNNRLVVAPWLAVAGSTFALFFTLVFAHRELTASPSADTPSETEDRPQHLPHQGDEAK
jgi:hypothetical protein